VGSAEAFESKVKKWGSKTMKTQPSDQLVEKAYCVGTTVDQWVLKQSQSLFTGGLSLNDWGIVIMY
jgi:predicted secreted protein